MDYEVKITKPNTPGSLMTFRAAANVSPSGEEGGKPPPRRQLGSPPDLIVTKVAIRPMKPCNRCGRPAPYVVYYNWHRWGWRLCWLHVPSGPWLSVQTRK